MQSPCSRTWFNIVSTKYVSLNTFYKFQGRWMIWENNSSERSCFVFSCKSCYCQDQNCKCIISKINAVDIQTDSMSAGPLALLGNGTFSGDTWLWSLIQNDIFPLLNIPVFFSSSSSYICLYFRSDSFGVMFYLVGGWETFLRLNNIWDVK